MEERVVSAKELLPTFVHCTNKNCPNGRKNLKTRRWLNQMLSDEKYSEVPPVTAVLDPETKKMLVYDGNIRQSHASENDCQLRAKILTNQADLDQYRESNETCWFGITDWNELLKFMKMYAAYPGDEDEKPEAFREMIAIKRAELQADHDHQLFGPDDDE